MSTLAVNTITNAAGGNTAQINGMTPTADSLQGFRNRIINGDMRIDQRNAGAAVTINNPADLYTLDRFAAIGQSGDGVFTVARSTVAPAGFTNSLLATVTTADASIGASQLYDINQFIEGFNVADLGWGAAGAATVTLSFWVRSSVTGTFGGALRNGSFNRSYPFTYSVSAANTWEYKTITVAGDTTGTWGTGNGIGLAVTWSLGDGSSRLSTAGAWAAGNFAGATGQTNPISTNGATFYITGVQLEAGSVATPFERRPYGTELALCQRYFIKYGGTAAYEYMTPYGITYIPGSNYVTSIFPVEMRSAPTVAFSTLRWTWQGASSIVSGVSVENAGAKTCGLIVSTAGGETAYRPGVVLANNSTSAFLTFSSEL